ncbi:MAG: hypothetical protein KDD03_13115 [Gelidibacter sp.]|nr:hypothetical protein [Gelidibacter sp.]
MAYSIDEIQNFKSLIIEGISNGKSLKSLLDNNKELPARQTVYNWLNSEHLDFDVSFLDNYVRAREESADLDAETIQDIAEKTLNGTYDPQSARVAMDAYKWNASKKQPKKYGDKVDLTTNGKDITSITRIIIDESKHTDS